MQCRTALVRSTVNCVDPQEPRTIHTRDASCAFCMNGSQDFRISVALVAGSGNGFFGSGLSMSTSRSSGTRTGISERP